MKEIGQREVLREHSMERAGLEADCQGLGVEGAGVELEAHRMGMARVEDVVSVTVRQSHVCSQELLNKLAGGIALLPCSSPHTSAC